MSVMKDDWLVKHFKMWNYWIVNRLLVEGWLNSMRIKKKNVVDYTNHEATIRNQKQTKNSEIKCTFLKSET